MYSITYISTVNICLSDPLPKKIAAVINLADQQNAGSLNNTGEMLPKTRKLLESFYKPHNEKLAKLLKDDGYLWNT